MDVAHTHGANVKELNAICNDGTFSKHNSIPNQLCMPYIVMVAYWLILKGIILQREDIFSNGPNALFL